MSTSTRLFQKVLSFWINLGAFWRKKVRFSSNTPPNIWMCTYSTRPGKCLLLQSGGPNMVKFLLYAARQPMVPLRLDSKSKIARLNIMRRAIYSSPAKSRRQGLIVYFIATSYVLLEFYSLFLLFHYVGIGPVLSYIFSVYSIFVYYCKALWAALLKYALYKYHFIFYYYTCVLR